MRRWQQLLALRAEERKILFIALLALPFIDLLLRLVGFQRTQRWLALVTARRRPHAFTDDAQIVQHGHTLARLIAIAAQHGIYRVTCLRRSLLLWGWLRRQGIASDLRLGVRMAEQPLAAHAWVEYQGIALGADGAVCQQFVVIEHFVFAEQSN